MLFCAHAWSINAVIYSFFPNLPRLSLFFLNLPCCISFFFSFPCAVVPLLAAGFPPSNFLFLSLLEVKPMLNICRISKSRCLLQHCTSWCWRQLCSPLSSAPPPILHHLHEFCTCKYDFNSNCDTEAHLLPTLYSLFQVHFFDFLYILLVSFLKLLSCFALQLTDV